MGTLPTTCRNLVGWTPDGRVGGRAGSLGCGNTLLRTAPRCKWKPESIDMHAQLVLWEGDGAVIGHQVVHPCRHGGAGHFVCLVLSGSGICLRSGRTSTGELTSGLASWGGPRSEGSLGNENGRWESRPSCFDDEEGKSTTVVCGPWHTAGKEWPGRLASPVALVQQGSWRATDTVMGSGGLWWWCQ